MSKTKPTYRAPTDAEIEEAVGHYETILQEMGKVDDCGLTLQDNARLWLQAWFRVTQDHEKSVDNPPDAGVESPVS